ncbi:MAG: SIS domain-containing protein [Gammaproteobacteria bacterium]|nr:SIS domain-containing protein [Gammaproteobacteria bacterium]
MKNDILNALTDAKIALESFINDGQKIERVSGGASIMIDCLRSGGSIYSCGNGGSMSDAMHFAEELTGRYRQDRLGLSAAAISDPGHISCVANDFGYEHIFSRYLEARARPGDCLLAISTSGSSKNVIRAANYARENSLKVVSLTGKNGSALGQIADIDIYTVDRQFADKVQELHIKIIHILIELIEREFFPGNYSSNTQDH